MQISQNNPSFGINMVKFETKEAKLSSITESDLTVFKK